MLDDSLRSSSHTLIAGRFAVDTAQILADAGGGIPAYLAKDRLAADGRRAALLVSRDASPRLTALELLEEPVDNLMTPLGHGVAPMAGGKTQGYFIVCGMPPGPPVSEKLTPWTEKALLDLVLRPAARVLDFLHSRKLTHRAIRPNNVFQPAPGQPVTLGAAWAAPPAMHQPSVFESPYAALCHPAGRGDGTIADDVYALGVLLVTLVGGKVPMTQFDDLTAIRWKLDLGSFSALTRGVPLSNAFADLLRGMLAEDPDHRPLPSLLLDPTQARTRRVAARPPRRSQRPLMLNDIAVFESRMLAFALFSDEKRAVQFLRNGQITQWMRRGLGDATLAAKIEDLVRGRLTDTRSGGRADPLLVMHTIAALDSRMPLCWRGLAVWPDALPSLLAEGLVRQDTLLSAAEELLAHDIASDWSMSDPDAARTDAFTRNSRLYQQRKFLQSGGSGGLARLYYSLNPLLPCRAPAMGSVWIATITDLMAFLDKAAERAGETLIDVNIAAFVAARADRGAEVYVDALIDAKTADSFRRDELALLNYLQDRFHRGPLPGLAKWVAGRLGPDLDRWHNRPKRAALHARMGVLASAGILARMLALATNATEKTLDLAGMERARIVLAAIDAEIASIESGDALRTAESERFGQAIAGGVGLSAFIVTVLWALLL